MRKPHSSLTASHSHGSQYTSTWTRLQVGGGVFSVLVTHLVDPPGGVRTQSEPGTVQDVNLHQCTMQ